MGAGIAEVAATAGCPVVLLDLTEAAAAEGRDRCAEEVRDRITIGTFGDDLDRLAAVDWIVEVVVENLEIKRSLFERVEAVRRDGSIVTSNTSGIPLAQLAEGMPDRFRADVAITHFFNPPQVMKLFELVAGADTSPEVITALAGFAADRLDKGVVYAKDTPNFIGNRIGCYLLMHGFHAAKPFLAADGPGPLDQETIDAALGAPLGLPPTGLYGLSDLIGLDVLALIGDNLAESLPDGDPFHTATSLPELERQMFERGQLGRKSGGGFTRVTKDPDGAKHREVFDLVTAQWRPATVVDPADLPSGPAELLFADTAVGRMAWSIFGSTLAYAADLVPEISDDVVNVDRAMRWGFNWAQGPFEMLDSIGPRRFLDRWAADGGATPAMFEVLNRAGADSFYGNDGGEFLAVDGTWQAVAD
jgi:3-hydroxyacyl-CoA dehydrogenase